MANSKTDEETRLRPARLSFLAIYNPTFGPTDETFPDQVVYWYSRTVRERHKDAGDRSAAAQQRQEDEHAKLRQVGLAQGMINFSTSFAGGQPADAIDTEKSRVIVHELEPDWWVLASIDLTAIPLSSSASGSSNVHSTTVEYSSREISPPALLQMQLVQANRIFLMHHGRSLEDLYARCTRSRFCGLLERYWNRFLSDWDVLLHGNPAVCIYDGIKLSAGGELGIGVGEEEWGSGERDVLEGFASRTEGLVDMIVARYGEPPIKPTATAEGKHRYWSNLDDSGNEKPSPWLGACNPTEGTDGVVFSGSGTLAKSSLRDIANWMQQIYRYGNFAYGVKENPSTDRRRRRWSPKARSTPTAEPSTGKADTQQTKKRLVGNGPKAVPPGIPPPIVSAAESSLQKATKAVSPSAQPAKEGVQLSDFESQNWMKYLKLGYGSVWGPSTQPPNESEPAEETPAKPDKPKEPATERRKSSAMQQLDPVPETDAAEEAQLRQSRLDTQGHFLIGLTGPMEDDVSEEDESEHRIMLRTLYLSVASQQVHPLTPKADDDITVSSDHETTSPFSPFTPETSIVPADTGLKRLRVIVYVQQPFIYTFLFRLNTEALQLASFYRNIHTYFAPLRPLMSKSTSPERVASRVASAGLLYPSPSPSAERGKEKQGTRDKSTVEPIYDLVFDHSTLNTHSNLPNIPLPGSLAAIGMDALNKPLGWTRAEALNVHSTIVENFRRSKVAEEVEKSIKTSRGWWIVWMRLGVDEEQGEQASAEDHTAASKESRQTSPSLDTTASMRSVTPPADLGDPKGMTVGGTGSYFHGTDAPPPPLPRYKEAILVRRARDSATSKGQASGRSVSGLWSFGGSGAGKDTSAGWGPARLAEGVGVDARRYVEGLIGLGR